MGEGGGVLGYINIKYKNISAYNILIQIIYITRKYIQIQNMLCYTILIHFKSYKLCYKIYILNHERCFFRFGYIVKNQSLKFTFQKKNYKL